MRTFGLLVLTLLLWSLVATMIGKGPRMVEKVEVTRRLVDDVVAHRDTNSGDVRLEFATEPNVPLFYTAELRGEVHALDDGEVVSAVYRQHRTGQASRGDTTWNTSATYVVEQLICTRPVP
jgi:hypothetical protein